MHTRRSLTFLASALLGATVALSGCGDDSAGSAGLTVMTGGGIYGDSLQKTYLDPFAQETGVKVANDPTLSYAKIKTQVEANNVTIDLVPAEGYWAVQQCGKLLEPLDKSIVDTSKINPALIQDECSAPLLTYLTGIYYNNKRFTGDKPTGCAGFFDTVKFPGKRAVSANAIPNALVECALIADGVPRESLYPLDVERAFKKIATIKKDLVFWNSGSDSTQLMVTGEVAMIMAWNGRAYAAIGQQNATYSQALGETFLIYDALVVPKGVKDKANAMKLVNFMLDPARQATLTGLIPYSPSNTTAKLPDLPAALKEYLPETNPALAATVIVQDQRWWAANDQTVTQTWDTLLKG